MNTGVQDKSAVDLETSLRRLGGDKKLLAKMAEFFLEDGPNLKTQLVAAHLSGDLDTVAHRAHSLKGLSATFEAITFLKLASEIESLARAKDDLRLNHKISELENEFKCLVAHLERIIHEVASHS